MEHITIMTSITASGFYFKPFIIFQRKTCPEVLINTIAQDYCHIGGQEEGWICEKSILEWQRSLLKKLMFIEKIMESKIKHYTSFVMVITQEKMWNLSKH